MTRPSLAAARGAPRRFARFAARPAEHEREARRGLLYAALALVAAVVAVLVADRWPAIDGGTERLFAKLGLGVYLVFCLSMVVALRWAKKTALNVVIALQKVFLASNTGPVQLWFYLFGHSLVSQRYRTAIYVGMATCGVLFFLEWFRSSHGAFPWQVDRLLTARARREVDRIRGEVERGVLERDLAELAARRAGAWAGPAGGTP